MTGELGAQLAALDLTNAAAIVVKGVPFDDPLGTGERPPIVQELIEALRLKLDVPDADLPFIIWLGADESIETVNEDMMREAGWVRA